MSTSPHPTPSPDPTAVQTESVLGIDDGHHAGKASAMSEQPDDPAPAPDDAIARRPVDDRSGAST